MNVVADVAKEIDETDVARWHTARDPDEDEEELHQQHDDDTEAERGFHGQWNFIGLASRLSF